MVGKSGLVLLGVASVGLVAGGIVLAMRQQNGDGGNGQDPVGQDRVVMTGIANKIGVDDFEIDVSVENKTSQSLSLEAIIQIKNPLNQVEIIESSLVTLVPFGKVEIPFDVINLLGIDNRTGTWFADLFVWRSLENPEAFSRTRTIGLQVG